MTPLDDTRHCPMCEDAAKKILELEQRVKVLVEARSRVLISYGSISDIPAIGYVEPMALDFVGTGSIKSGISDSKDFYNTVIKPCEIALSPSQTADQVLRWHVEWMKQQPVIGYYQMQKIGNSEWPVFSIVDELEWHPLVAIPPLPKESKE